ncbi:hypothetical protein CAOG_08385 [Capsaspora owczarzaki ATCC 30864]|nr:hypothetical protein CAOG_08385 [Capsaspora owczarzaki ATCC 30864]|eukprot:XP_011269955.1 hypothetical protein CAOG_08385 [Capsaspora owczarzaki ATCC 30864]
MELRSLDGSSDASPSKKARSSMQQELMTWRIISLLLIGAVIGLSVALGVIYTTHKDLEESEALAASRRDSCPATGIPGASGSSKPGPSPFSAADPHPLEDLYPSETQDIFHALMSNASLQLTPYDDAALSDNFIWAMELDQPAKFDVLNWRDGNNQPKPIRFARVVIFHGAWAVPEVVEYRVGPLPVSASNFRVWPVRHVPWIMRPMTVQEYDLLEGIITDAFGQLATICTESFGGTYDEEALTWTDSSPRGYNRTERHTWVWAMHNVDGAPYLLPTGLELMIDHTDVDPSNWFVKSVAYNLQAYDTIAELIDQYNNNASFVKINFPAPTDPYYLIEQSKPTRQNAQHASPRHVNPGGQRFTVNGPQVEYLGWKFLITSSFRSGISFSDISFLNETIVYELSQQAAAATYSGRPAAQSASQYDDSGWGMGAAAQPLIRGVACPETGVFADVFMWWNSGNISHFQGAVCIFEKDLGTPIASHFNKGNDGLDFATGIHSTALVVRFISTVYNYDYVLTYTFFLDGSMDVDMSATGYMQAGRWADANDNQFGTRVQDQVMGNLHDHILNFKVDLDIAGTANTVDSIGVAYDTFPENPFLPPSKLAKKLTHNLIATEMASKMRLNPSNPHLITVINTDEPNAWGVSRGYKFHLHSQANSLQTPALEWWPAFSWLENSFVATKRKESEHRSVEHFYDMNAPDVPLVRFLDFVEDDESILQEDLVLWVNVGSIHIPSAEDIPLTTIAGQGIGFTLRPFNYFDAAKLEDLRQRIYIAYNPARPSVGLVEVDTAKASECFQSTPDYSFSGSNLYGDH